MGNWWTKLNPKAAGQEGSVNAAGADPYKEGLRLYEAGRYVEAYQYLAKALQHGETSQRWNDWAAAQLALRNVAEAERGFRKAVQMDPGYGQANANLGALLTQQGRKAEAVPFLEKALSGIDAGQKDAIEKLLAHCKQSGASGANVSGGALKQIVDSLSQQQLALNSLSVQVATLNDALSRLAPPTVPLVAPSIETRSSDFPIVPQATVLAIPNSFTLLAAGDPNFGLLELGLIACLMRTAKAKRIFDLSDADGQSALNLAANTASSAQIYRFSASETGNGVDPQFDLAKYQDRIISILRSQTDCESSDLHHTFDFVLVDAGRERTAVLTDSRLALKLLRSNGTIVWRNSGEPDSHTSATLREVSLVEPGLGNLRRIEKSSLIFALVHNVKDAATALKKQPRLRRARIGSLPSVVRRSRTRGVTFADTLANADRDNLTASSSKLDA
jgi:tetratricopeptide (TPR) repeat protein